MHHSAPAREYSIQAAARQQDLASMLGALPAAVCACACKHMQKATHEDLAGVAVLQGQTRVSNQVGQAISAAQQASLGVVGEAGLGALHGGLQGQGGSGVRLVLRLWQAPRSAHHALIESRVSILPNPMGPNNNNRAVKVAV